jgi:hypothetical protein
LRIAAIRWGACVQAQFADIGTNRIKIKAFLHTLTRGNGGRGIRKIAPHGCTMHREETFGAGNVARAIEGKSGIACARGLIFARGHRARYRISGFWKTQLSERTIFNCVGSCMGRVLTPRCFECKSPAQPPGGSIDYISRDVNAGENA